MSFQQPSDLGGFGKFRSRLSLRRFMRREAGAIKQRSRKAKHPSCMMSMTKTAISCPLDPLLYILCSTCHKYQETVVHRAVLPYERNGPDISWMRVPIVLLGLLVVAVTQGACARSCGKRTKIAGGGVFAACM